MIQSTSTPGYAVSHQSQPLIKTFKAVHVTCRYPRLLNPSIKFTHTSPEVSAGSLGVVAAAAFMLLGRSSCRRR
ncbi:hypothetical protein DL546_005821 [Coniochaeta pulveracea]|uniref:Uncharacterized protein n=1 Tax=Coniochaeta pulveracea TaxID=177199 RepID=A0A420YI23_9PEZI|nr:hypothetical protein DL546_005821 [Coniochaeta pulveracea]